MHIEGALLGLLVGWLRGGQLRRLAGLSLPGWPLAVLGLAIQTLIKVSAGCGWESVIAVAPYLHIASFLPLLCFIYLSHRRGMLLMGLGLLLNLIVIVANQGFMPVNVSGLDPFLQEQLRSGAASPLHTLLTDETILPLLGDQIPITYVFNRLISIGDILLALGITILIQHHMVRCKRV